MISHGDIRRAVYGGLQYIWLAIARRTGSESSARDDLCHGHQAYGRTWGCW